MKLRKGSQYYNFNLGEKYFMAFAEVKFKP